MRATLCVYCGKSMEVQKAPSFFTKAQQVDFEKYTLLINNSKDVPKFCYDCYKLQINHRHYKEKSTQVLLNFKVLVLISLFISGYVSLNRSWDKNSEADLIVSSQIDMNTGEVYSLSHGEIAKKRREMVEMIELMDSVNRSQSIRFSH